MTTTAGAWNSGQYKYDQMVTKKSFSTSKEASSKKVDGKEASDKEGSS
jgi:hypothetical protein